MSEHDNMLNYFRAFRLGRLFFKYIQRTELETHGWTSETLAGVLQEWGMLKVITRQTQDGKGRFDHGLKFYVWLPGKEPRKEELLRAVLEKFPSPPKPQRLSERLLKESERVTLMRQSIAFLGLVLLVSGCATGGYYQPDFSGLQRWADHEAAQDAAFTQRVQEQRREQAMPFQQFQQRQRCLQNEYASPFVVTQSQCQ